MQEFFGTYLITSVETNLAYKPVLNYLNQNSLSEILPVGTILTINLLSEYSYRLLEIEVINLNENKVEIISLQIIKTNGKPIEYGNGSTIYINQEGQPTLYRNDSNIYLPIKQIIITIMKLKDNNKNCTIDISIMGCFRKGKKL